MKNNKFLLLCVFFLMLASSLMSQKYFEIPLYDSINTDKDGDPSIRVYLPEKPNGCAVIACPGGGYSYLEMNKEGYAFAPWFTRRGVTFIVLKYRLPKGNPEQPLQDAKRAISIVRERAKEWEVNLSKIGAMGSSAGGHLASTLATHFEEENRPCFQILLYPVITMNRDFTHIGSRNELLGENPSDNIIKLYSNELQVSSDTPPAFIALSDNDNIVPSKNSVEYYLALNRNKVSAEMHIYPRGGHGWGMHSDFFYYNQWTTALEIWMKNQNYIDK